MIVCETKRDLAQPAKILFLIDELQVGGTERQLIWLCERLPRSLFAPTIGVLRANTYQQELSLQTPVVNFRWQGLPLVKNLQLIMRLRRYLQQEGFDILQTQFVESEIYGSVAALTCGKRPLLVSTRRNLYHWINEDPWRFRLGRYLSRHADHVLVNSHAVQERCTTLEEVPGAKLTVIQNGVQPERFGHGDPARAKEALGLAADDFVVGVVGNWRPVKGLVSFLAAARIIAATVPQARFILAGSGPQEEELHSAAGKTGLRQSILFVKHSPDIPGVIAAMDVAVQSSLSESFSNVLLEYMAAGKAIVATRVGDADVMLAGGQCGLLVAPESPEEMAEAVTALFNNRHKARAMGQLARQRAEAEWSEEVIVEQYQRFYRDLLQAGRGHGHGA